MKYIRIILAVLLSLLWATPVMAGTSVLVGITATPSITTGILNFTIVYISETQLDLSWNLAGGTDKIMIRAKYGEYPADIPDENTAPSDGYLVYYGNGLAVSDTSMDFDDNPGFLYYKAWAQKLDGTWYVATSTGKKESELMALIVLIGLALVVSGFAVQKKNTVVGIVASACWLVVISYTRSNPVGNMTIGDTADNTLLTALIGMLVLVPIVSWRLDRNDRTKESREVDIKERSTLRPKNNPRPIGTRESSGEYYDRLSRLTTKK